MLDAKHPLPAQIATEVLKSFPKAPDGLKYLVIGPNCFGADESAPVAVKIARHEGGAGIYVIHLVNNLAAVDAVDGTVYYSRETHGVKMAICYFKQL